MRPTILYGEFDLSVDDKNRLSIPSDVRKSMDVERDGSAFFVIVGVNQWPWLYPERAYEDLVAKSNTELAPGDDILDFDQMNFAMACKVEWDKQGRIGLPEKTIERTGLEKEITMIGVRDHLELWNRSQWIEQSKKLLARRAEIAFRAKQAKIPTA